MADLVKFLAALERIGRDLNTQTQDDYALIPTPLMKEHTMHPSPLLTPEVVEQLHAGLQRIPTPPRQRLVIRSRSGHGIALPASDDRNLLGRLGKIMVGDWAAVLVEEDGTPHTLEYFHTGAAALAALPRLMHEVGLASEAPAGGVLDAA